MAPLPDGRRDPWTGRAEPQIPEDVWAWRAAAEHLHAARLVGVAPARVLAEIGPVAGLAPDREVLA